jgi:hypothetical protein
VFIIYNFYNRDLQCGLVRHFYPAVLDIDIMRTLPSVPHHAAVEGDVVACADRVKLVPDGDRRAEELQGAAQDGSESGRYRRSTGKAWRRRNMSGARSFALALVWRRGGLGAGGPAAVSHRRRGAWRCAGGSFIVTVENLALTETSFTLAGIPVSENKEIRIDRVSIVPAVRPDSRSTSGGHGRPTTPAARHRRRA